MQIKDGNALKDEGALKNGGASESARSPLLLLVEDQLLNQKLFSLQVRETGYRYEIAEDGFEALEKAEKFQPDIIFMDIELPRMDGYETTQKLREKGFTNPIIAVTANTLPEEYRECLARGMDDVLIKPVKKTDIKAILDKWLPKNIEGAASIKETISQEAPQKARASVFNQQEAIETFLGNKELLLSLLNDFIKRTEDQLKLFPLLAEKQNWKDGTHEAHIIKGSSLTLTAKEIGQLSTQLETAFKEANPAKINSLLSELSEALTRLCETTKAFAENT